MRRFGGHLSVGVVLTLTAALVATVLGAGALTRTLAVSDGDVWLWSSSPGQVGRVNANSGRVDQNQQLLDARGHRIQVVQNDRYLLLHDLDTGLVRSVDLRRMGFTGSLDVGRADDDTVALTGSGAVLVDRTTGTVRGLDPATLRVTKARLALPGPLVGGDFDAHGALWLGIPSQGTVVSVEVTATAARVRRTEAVLAPGHDMAVSVLDGGVLAVDRGGRAVAVVTDRVRTVTAPVPLAGAELPARTAGDLAAVTVPAAAADAPAARDGSGSGRAAGEGSESGRATADRTVAGRVVVVAGLAAGPAAVSSFALPPGMAAGAAAGTAVPFAGRIYLPDTGHHVVYVYDRSGRRLDTLGMAGATGPLELAVQDGHLMINAPDSSVARVVDPDGVTRLVDKYQLGRPGDGGDLAMIAAPGPVRSSGATGQPGTAGPVATGRGSKAGTERPAGVVAGAPGPPVPVTALAGTAQVALSWPAPAANGDPVQRYDVTWHGGSRRVGGGTTSLEVTGLSAGTAYTFSVTATNRYGTSAPALSGTVTPSGAAPDPPTAVAAAVDARGAVTVSWTASAGAADYLVRPSGGATAETVTDTSAAMTGLTLGDTYTFTVVARNADGVASAPSAPSGPVIPFGPPGMPTLTVGEVSTSTVTIEWSAAAANGRPITGYYVDLSDNPAWTSEDLADSRSHVFVGLSPGQGYWFYIWATNAAGDGPKARIQGTTAAS